MVKTKGNALEKKDSAIKNKIGSSRNYIGNVYNELKKVHWPNRKQILGYTGVVIFTVIVVTLILWIFDSGLSFLLDKLFKAFA